jgi:hypothetical protein
MSRSDLIDTIRQEGRSHSGSRERSRARQFLVVSELALSLVLMVAAGLLLRSFWDLFTVQPGFNPDRVIAVQTWLPGPNDPTADKYRSPAEESVLVREILRRSRSLPGVEAAAAGNAIALPLGHARPGTLALVREGTDMTESEAPEIASPIVSPEYFQLLSMPLVRGRLFTDEDVADQPRVAVINQAAARAYWPDQDPLGSFAPGCPRTSHFGRADVDHDRGRDRGRAHRIALRPSDSANLSQRVPAPVERSGHHSSRPAGSQRSLGADERAHSVHRSGTSGLPRRNFG